MIVRGYRHESVKFGEKAIAAARQENQTADLAWLLVYGLGWREINGGDLDRGEALMREGLQIYETLNDGQGIRTALRRLGRVLQYKNDYAAARRCYERGMNLANASSDELAMAGFEREVALMALEEGKFAEAKDRLEAILPVLRERHEFTLASVLGELASAYRGLGQLERAYQFGSEGLELAKKMKRRETVGWLSLTLAHLEAARGNDRAALALAQQGWDFFERTDLFRDDEAIKRASTLIKDLQKRLAMS
jgi:tetratricopeptide (TPR) repeat protein